VTRRTGACPLKHAQPSWFLVRQIEVVNAEIAALDTTLRGRTKANELGSGLETITSVGLVIASALRAWVTAALFSRHLSVVRRGGRLIRIHSPITSGPQQLRWCGAEFSVAVAVDEGCMR